MNWYYVDADKNRKGPMEDGAFKELVSKGIIKTDTLVWHKGLNDWQPYGQLSSGKDETPLKVQKLECSQCGKAFLKSDLIEYQKLLVCANCKPLFLQKLKEGVPVFEMSEMDKYGSIEKGVQGHYDFTISDILNEAWSLMKGTKRYILGGIIIMYLILFFTGIGLGIVKAVLFGISEKNIGANISFEVFIRLVTIIITYPITAGIMMICIRRSVGLPIDFSLVFNYFHKTGQLVLMYIIQVSLVILGLLLLIIPGIYLVLSYSMALPLVVEKNLGPWEALETSRKAITKDWFHIFGFMLIMFIIVVAGLIPFGIGLIWTIPLSSLAFGILYRNIFGVEEVRRVKTR